MISNWIKLRNEKLDTFHYRQILLRRGSETNEEKRKQVLVTNK